MSHVVPRMFFKQKAVIVFSEPTFRFLLVTSVPYGVLEITSGAIQYGVPTRDFLFGTSLLIWAQNPKSDSFICRRRKGKSCTCSIIVSTVSRKNSSVSLCVCFKGVYLLQSSSFELMLFFSDVHPTCWLHLFTNRNKQYSNTLHLLLSLCLQLFFFIF